MPNVQFDSSDTYIVRTSQTIYYVPWTVGGGRCLLPWRLLATCCNGNPGAQGHGPALDVLRNIWMNKLCAAARRRMAKMEDLLFMKCAARFACGLSVSELPNSHVLQHSTHKAPSGRKCEKSGIDCNYFIYHARQDSNSRSLVLTPY